MKTETQARPIEVLLCDDSPGDVRLTREAFREANRAVNLHVVTDGVEAIAFLKHERDYLFCPRPDLILLDLNMPKMDGREVWAYIKTDSYFRTIPVLILTTSHSEADITKTYQLAANCYLTKPVGLEDFEELVKSINDFWLSQAKLPKASLKIVSEDLNASHPASST